MLAKRHGKRLHDFGFIQNTFLWTETFLLSYSRRFVPRLFRSSLFEKKKKKKKEKKKKKKKKKKH